MAGKTVADLLLEAAAALDEQRDAGSETVTNMPAPDCTGIFCKEFCIIFCKTRALKSHAFGVRHTQFNPSTRSHATLRISHAEKLPG